MNLCADYFYCLNYTPHGMLSIDILLVTLFLMIVTPYPGDHFSLDSLRRARKGLAPPQRPIFLVRLLQLQLAISFFHTGLCKLMPGNWWTDNPYWYVMSTPKGGIVRDAFFIKGFLAARPRLCRVIGLTVVANELAAPVLLFVPLLRPLGIALGLYFQLMLFWSLHVPTTTFFFTFPCQILLFIHPKKVESWLERAGAGLPAFARLVPLAALLLALSGCAAPPPAPPLRKGVAAKIRFTLKADGKELASTDDTGPLVFTQGSGQLPFGLEEKLEGMTIGEKRTVRVPPKKAFGKADPRAFLRVPKSSFADESSLVIGGAVQGQLNGRPFRARVASIGKDEVVLDFNPPLAGKTLVFEAELVDSLPEGL
jgi:FKBP-type peptidyl-prolyl cis-trans isomerase 2